MHKDIFISHTWKYDNLKRDNHKRCKMLCDKLKDKGYSIWFDHYDMGGDVNNSIIKAINNCKIFIVCLTEAYCDKINGAIKNNRLNDNCFKEWNYAIYKDKKIVPVIMEPDTLNNYFNREGIINMYLNSLIYFDITHDDYTNNDFDLLCKIMRKHGIYNTLEKEILNVKDNSSFNTFLEYIQETFKMSNKNIIFKNNTKLKRTIIYI